MGRTFDSYVEQLGAFGTYQKVRFYFFCLPAVSVSTFSFFALIFALLPVKHSCSYPIFTEERNLNETILAMFYDPNFNSSKERDANSCTMYSPDCDVFEEPCRSKLMSQKWYSNESWQEYPCQYGYKYHGDKYSLVERWNLVCDRKWIVSFILTLAGVGQIIGALSGSLFTDNLGRKKTFFAVLTWHLVTSFVMLFMPNWQSFAALALLRTIAAPLLFHVLWVYALELVPPPQHALATFFMMSSWAFFGIVLALIAFLSSTWLQIIAITTFYSSLFYLMIPLMDESPRWLMATKRFDQLKNVLEHIAEINEVPVDLNELHNLIDEEALIDHRETEAQGNHNEGKLAHLRGLWSLFGTKDLASKTIAVTFIWAVDLIVYEGMMLNVKNAGTNIYLDFALLSAVEILSDIAIYFTADRLGRISPLAFSTALGGLSCIAVVFIPDNLQTLITIFVLISKFFNTLSFDFIYLVGAEVYPTVLRGTGVGFSSAVANIAYVPTPFIIHAAHYIPYLPMLVFGSLSVLAGAVSFFLPETARHHMPDRVEQTREMPMGIAAFKDNVTCRNMKAEPVHV